MKNPFAWVTYESYKNVICPTVALFLSTVALFMTGIGLYVAWNVLGVQQQNAETNKEAQDKRIQKLEDFNNRLLEYKHELETEVKRNIQREADSLKTAKDLYEKSVKNEEMAWKVYDMTMLAHFDVWDRSYGQAPYSQNLISNVSIRLLAKLQAKGPPYRKEELNLIKSIDEVSEAHMNVLATILANQKALRDNFKTFLVEYQQAAKIDDRPQRFALQSACLKRFGDETGRLESEFNTKASTAISKLQQLLNEQGDLTKKSGLFPNVENK